MWWRLLFEIMIIAMLGACLGVPSDSFPPAQGDTTAAYPLVATTGALQEDCQAAAELLAFSVPCPSALPATNDPVRCEIPGAFRDAQVNPKEGCALGRGFLLAPTGIQDLDLFHLLIEGALEEQFGCGMNEPHEHIQTIHGQASLFACSDAGLHEGHTLIRFELDNVFVNVSAHGHTDLNKSVVLAIADAIRMVPPS